MTMGSDADPTEPARTAAVAGTTESRSGRTAAIYGRDPETTPDPAYVAIRNEAVISRKDLVRWGPIWAGFTTALATFLLLQLALVATGIVEVARGAPRDAAATAIVAFVAFFVGGAVTGASSLWSGAGDGAVHGVIMWALALVALLVFAAVGSGLTLGALDTTAVFNEFTIEGVDVNQATDNAKEASRYAVLGLLAALVASAAGGAIGSKMWPRDKRFDVRTGKDLD